MRRKFVDGAPNYVLIATDGSEYCNDGEFRKPAPNLSVLAHDHRPKVFYSKASAAGKARFIGRVTTIAEWKPGDRSGGPT